MQVDTRLSDELVRYLDLSATEAKLTAANLANVDTPGYRTQGFDFAAEIRKALNGVGTGREMSPNVHEIDGLISRPDGNNVSMDREGLHLAEAQLKFKAGVALLRLENQRVLNAIHADKG
jgi:flagellar basal-body rod protein FlgB